jgi:hypothetical protein
MKAAAEKISNSKVRTVLMEMVAAERFRAELARGDVAAARSLADTLPSGFRRAAAYLELAVALAKQEPEAALDTLRLALQDRETNPPELQAAIALIVSHAAIRLDRDFAGMCLDLSLKNWEAIAREASDKDSRSQKDPNPVIGIPVVTPGGFEQRIRLHRLVRTFSTSVRGYSSIRLSELLPELTALGEERLETFVKAIPQESPRADGMVALFRSKLQSGSPSDRKVDEKPSAR